MNKKTKFTVLSLVSISAFSVLIGATLFSNGTLKSLAADVTPVMRKYTLTNKDLQSVTLSNHDYGRAQEPTNNKPDQEFRIPLTEERFIDGGLIFTDCRFLIAADNLGGKFTLDNTQDPEEKSNSYNFNFLLSVKGVKEVSLTYTVTINQFFSDEINVRDKVRNGVDNYNNFYDDITSRYDALKSDNNSFYNDIGYVSTKKNYYDLLGQHTITVSSTFPRNITNLHFLGDGIPTGIIVDYQIDEIKLEFDCNI